MTQPLRKICRWGFVIGWLALFPTLVWGQCDFSPWVTVWPIQAEIIQPRQLFLFSGSGLGGTQSLASKLQQFTGSIRVYLWSSRDSVDLIMLDRLNFPGAGTFEDHTQLLLQPSRPLLPDTEYELRALRGRENLFYLFAPGRLAPGQRRATAYRWKTSSVPDSKAPVWLATPTVLQKKYEANSEGTDNYVLFSNPLRDSSKCLIKATIRDANDGASVTTYLLPWQNQLPIGWFTCGGDIRFKSEEEYSVRFEAIDAAGNRAFASGQPIRFRAPKKVACCWGK
ncbi:hypothetical protein [Hymenobacter sp. UYCo722]|uniref:hypothetical protein n=1 Tax=Hymenobacter sp. UYCo722 TaxID=3156335 RepID=UPI0033930A7F